MSPPLLVLWNDHPQVYAEALTQAGLGECFEVHAVKAAEPVPAELARRCEILLAWRPHPGLLAAMPRLRWIQSVTAGMEQWLHDPGLRADVLLTCARGAHRIQMPENILGALFHLTKPYAACALEQRDRRWVRQVSEPLAGKTLGILGLGAIGQELARKAAALEMRVIGTRRSPQPLPHVARVFAPQATDEVLGAADFVLLLLPLTQETDNFMDAKRLAAMRANAWLLNFARGALVVDADLIDAVRRRVIAGAVLDVFRREPLPPEHPFWTTENIVVLPHIGGLHPSRDALVAEVFVDNARRYLRGETPPAAVDRLRGY
jgi:phosphoglycerate dehydrogenase-like enzyme